MIKLLETRVYEGKEYVAVEKPGCAGCTFSTLNTHKHCKVYLVLPCAYSQREESVIWLTVEDAALARLRGTTKKLKP